ncbi:MAG: potassium channel family protein [Candidatus Enteromonas sp.]
MKIVIAGGDSQAEFILSMFKGKENELIVINGNRQVADLLLKRCCVPVTCGDPWRKYILEEAGVYDADIFISLCSVDTDNFASCLLAKKVFNVKKCICVVNNPKNVDIYKKMGIDSVLSSTYLLAQSIRNESSMESLVKTLSIDNDKINVTEFTVLSRHFIANQKIRDIHFPNKIASIAAIKRDYQVIIPNGDIVLQPMDVLLYVCAPENSAKVSRFLSMETLPTKVKKAVEKKAGARKKAEQ